MFSWLEFFARPGSGCDNFFLALFSGRIFFHKQEGAGEGVLFSAVHERGIGGGGGGEDLHLLGRNVETVTGEAFQGRHVGEGAAGVGRHEIIGQKLRFAASGRQAVKGMFERHQVIHGLFAHVVKNMWDTMFRCDFKLAGYMVFHQFFQKCHPVPFVFQDQIVSDSGGDKYFFDTGQAAQSFQQIQVLGMVGAQGAAWNGKQTPFVLAGPFGYFFLAFKSVHVGCGAARSMILPLKSGYVVNCLAWRTMESMLRHCTVLPW